MTESTSTKVGAKILNKFVKSSHLSPMHSLANGFNEEDLIEFDERVKKFLNINLEHELEYICEPKIDGLSLNLTYKNGNLITAATRGDGKIGENVTQNIKNMYYDGDSEEIGSKKALMGALKLYLDFINLFILLLQLFGQRR